MRRAAIVLGMAALASATVVRPAVAIDRDLPNTADHTLELAATFTPRDDAPLDRAPLLGELELHVRRDGTITGFYRPEADGVPVPLSGATSNGTAFFDVGRGFTEFHVEARLPSDRDATNLAGSALIGTERYDLAAGPCQQPNGSRSILCQ